MEMVAFADVSCMMAWVSRFSKFLDPSFTSKNISTSWTEQLVGGDFGRDYDPDFLLVLCTYDGKNGL